MKVKPFLHDVVDVEKDKGEPWIIGHREVEDSPDKKAKPADGKFGVQPPAKTKPKGKESKKKKVSISLILRRCPSEVHQEMGNLYRSTRVVKDTFGNEREEHYFEPENFEEFQNEKARWMWKDTKNFVVEIDDEPKTLELYNTTRKDGEPPFKGGETILLDGHWTDELRKHFVVRYKWIRIEIIKANLKYESADAHKEDILLGNL